MSLKFGLGPLTTQIPPDDPRTSGEKLNEAVEMAEVADDNGFDSVWLSEHHGAEDNYLSSPFTLSAAMAQATDSVRIGTSIALAPFYEPTRLAEDVATVDRLSGGRFELGLGMGYQDREFERFNVPKSERIGRMVDAVKVCQKAWTGETFSYSGECHEYDNINVSPTPAQGNDLRIVIGALAEPAVRRAARIADGAIGVWIMPDELIEQIQSWARDERGDDTFRTHLFREIFVADTAEEAWQTVKDGAYYVNKQYYDAFEECSDDAEFPYPEEESLLGWGMYGDPDSLVEQILEFDGLLDAEDHMILRLEQPGVPHDDVLEAIQRVGRDVLPRVRDRL